MPVSRSFPLNAKTVAGIGAQVDNYFLATVTMNQIVSPDGDLLDVIGNIQSALASGERLFVNMGVQQQPGKWIGGPAFQNLPRIRDHIPSVAIILPAGIRMGNGDLESPACITTVNGDNVNDIGVCLFTRLDGR